MTNWDKYKNEIIEAKRRNSVAVFIQDHLKEIGINQFTDNDVIGVYFNIWLGEEYVEPKEPEVDWTEVKVDTPILVRGNVKGDWIRRYFAKYEDGSVYAWPDGVTSWTSKDWYGKPVEWKYAQLFKQGD